MKLICDYFEDAQIYIDNKNKVKYKNTPYIIVKMDCDNAEDEMLLDSFSWENNSLDKDWANEIIHWAKKHIDEILLIWNNQSDKLISERWNV